MAGFVELLDMLRGLDEKKREDYLRFYVNSSPAYDDLKAVVLEYPEIIRYAYEQGQETFSAFLKQFNRYALPPEALHIMEDIVDLNSVILNPDTIEYYTLSPKLTEKLIATRKDEFFTALKAVPVLFLSNEAAKILSEEIKYDTTYVLGQGENVIDNFFEDESISHAKLIRSFENDYDATMAYIREHSFDVAGRLSDEIIDKYINKNNNFVLDSDTITLAPSNIHLIEVSLKNNYKDTIAELQKWVFLLDKIPEADMVRMLEKRFVVTGNSYKMIEMWPGLIEASLKNNYAQTIRGMADITDYPFDESMSYKYFSIMKPYLEKNNFVLDENTINLTKISMDFADISMKNDPYNTILALLKNKRHIETWEYLNNIDIEDIFMNTPGFTMSEDLFDGLKGVLSDTEIKRLVKQSFKNDPYETFISGDYIYDYISQEEYDAIQKIVVENIDELDNSYETKKSATHLVNSNPKFIQKLLAENYDCGLKFLRVVDVTKLSDEAKNLVKQELTKNNYVVGYKDNNPYLVDLMFETSLENDFDKTMRHGIHELFILDSFVQEKLKQSKDKIEDLMVRGITQENCVFNATFKEFMSQDNNILVRALDENYSNTINNMARGDRASQFRLEDPEAYARVYQKLKENNFVLDENNANLLYMNPLFLIASLENDYEKTRELLMRDKLPFNNIDFSKEDISKVVSIVRDHGRDKELLSRLVTRFSSILDERFEKNIDLALEEIEKTTMPHAKYDPKHARSIMDKLIDRSYSQPIDFSKYPKFVSCMAWGLFNEGGNERYKNFLITHGAPLSYIPFTSLEEITPYLPSEDVVDLYKRVYFDNNYAYNKADEEKLLKCLNSRFTSIEDELAYLQSQGVTRRSMNLTQMLALAFFAKKDHAKKGLKGYSVDVFSYAKGMRNLGVCSGQNLRLYNGHDESIFGMMETIVHENNHARQDVDVRELNVDHDEDIIVYTKDKFLRMILREEFRFDYYSENYWNISFEYDTELKAQMESAKTLRLEDIILRQGDDVEALLDRESLTRFGAERNKYTLTDKRSFDGQEHSIDELFEYGLNVALKTKYTPNEIYRIYPIVKYEYDLTCEPVKRYSIPELLEFYKNSNDLDKGVYSSVLRHRLNPAYNSKYLDDIEVFKNAAGGDKELLGVLEKILDGLTQGKKIGIEKNAISLNKYLEEAERLIQEDTRVSREEYNRRKTA